MARRTNIVKWLPAIAGILLLVALGAVGCEDDSGEAEAAASEEGAESEAESDDEGGEEAGDDAEKAPEAESKLPPMPPLHTLKPDERMVVLASDPVPWTRLGELAVSLYDARLSMHRIVGGGIVMDLGEAPATKYIQGRWKAPWLAADVVTQEEAMADDVPELAGRRLVWNEGSAASLRFPLPDDLRTDVDYSLLVRLRPKNPAFNKRMGVRLNEAGVVGVTELDAGWQTAELEISAKDLVFGGENTLQVEFPGSYFEPGLGQTRVAAKFDWLRLVPSGQVANYRNLAPAGDFAVPDARILTTSWRSLGLPAPGRLDTYQVIPHHARLRLFLAPAPRTQTPTPFSIVIDTDSLESPKTLHSGTLEPGAPWKPLEFDLADYAGQGARLSFVAEPGEQGATATHAAVWLGEPALVIVRPKKMIGPPGPEIGVVDDEGEPTGPVPTRIAIIAIDALRPDRVLPDGKPHPATPVISGLAANGVRLEAVAQGSGSVVPTVSLLTGTYGSTHEVLDVDTHVRQSFVTLGDAFDEAGWETAMLSTDPWVSLKRGYAQGFDRYRNLVEEQGKATTSRLIDAATRIVKKQTDRSRIVYAQIGGLRLPHQPRSESLAKFFSGAYNGPINVPSMMNPSAIPMPLGANDARYLNAVYDAELFEIDALVGKFLKALDESGDMSKTLVIVTGVHGEPLGEDRELGYNNRPTDAEVRVPLVFHWPEGLPHHRHPRQLAELVDVMPTVVDLAGLPRPETVQGASIVNVLRGERENSATAGFSARDDTHRSVTWGPYHYLLRTGDNDLFFDLSLARSGPLEDQTDTLPIARRALRDALALHLAWVDSLGDKREYGSATAPRKSKAPAAYERGW